MRQYLGVPRESLEPVLPGKAYLLGLERVLAVYPAREYALQYRLEYVHEQTMGAGLFESAGGPGPGPFSERA